MGQFSPRPPHSALPPRPAKNFGLHAGKGFLVTGAAGGVGCAAVALLAARGARVALADVRAEALKVAVATTGSPEAFAVVGMAAFFTGVVQAPVTGIVLVVEMTAAFTTLLPMLGACFAAMLVANLLHSAPIYESLSERTLRPRGSEKA